MHYITYYSLAFSKSLLKLLIKYLRPVTTIYAKIKLAPNISITCSFIAVKCNNFLNKIAAKKNPTAVVVHKNVLILLNGLHASITAKMLTPPIIKYIRVCDSSIFNPIPDLVNVISMILIIIVKAYGNAFLITVRKKVPFNGFEFSKKDKKNEKEKKFI